VKFVKSSVPALRSAQGRRTILVTGGAGFIGSHLCDALLADGHRVVAFDNFDAFYGRDVKMRNLEGALSHPAFTLVEGDIRDADAVEALAGHGIDAIVHLAALAGVRPSIESPERYYDVNVKGTQVMLEFAKRQGIRQFVFASSSSVYGNSPNVPWREDEALLRPISPYASTKLAGEQMGHVYSHLYGIRFVGLRFFTVFGPRQRPDLAIHKFARLMLDGKPIPFFGDGTTGRDYTFVSDTVAGIRGAIAYEASDYAVFNLGNSRVVTLNELVSSLETAFETKAELDRQPMQPGDVEQTCADIGKAARFLGYDPQTPLETGLSAFRNWLTIRESSVPAYQRTPLPATTT
jgi:UDP-glucuronate 4-epimerase